jgi:hypothetical protein
MEHELAHSIGVYTLHSPNCVDLVPVLLTLHSTLHNRDPADTTDIPFLIS